MHWLVPKDVNSLFTGRNDIIKEIKDAVVSSTPNVNQKRFVLTGIGGQGKSEVCLRVVNEVREWYVIQVFADSSLT